MAGKSALIWTAPALDDLDEIASWIARENERAAAALVRRVLDELERLREHPSSGRWVPEIRQKLYREVIVPPCRIIYRPEGTDVLIVHVIRSERLLDIGKLF
ncbi:MAG TPA: type II toxin-antitoxin system RelE/ParE family toxin [Polyangium sp.]|nr:type II toxin-antitoxin system RelE/ParE family toxin [Polyangium sp.]